MRGADNDSREKSTKKAKKNREWGPRMGTANGREVGLRMDTKKNEPQMDADLRRWIPALKIAQRGRAKSWG